MLLEELFRCKNKLMEILCSDKEIVRLITDASDAPVPNYDLAYTRIYPYEFIPETVDDGKVFICYDMDVRNVDNKTFLDQTLYVWIIAHKSKMRLSEGGVRTDKLAEVISKELNGNRFFGLGELDLLSVKGTYPTRDFLGRELKFVMKDFNRTTPTGKQIPAIRK